ncbi:MAG: CHAP domain-containing protein [Sphingobium sp.]
MVRYMGWMACMLSGVLAAPVDAATPGAVGAVLQCVPYARAVSGLDIRGDALGWWEQARDRYKRGDRPRRGAVLAFRPTGAMALGHVAVVSRILDDRRVLVRHANWSAPGSIEEDVLAIDVSAEGDWSKVRVWHSPTGQIGSRINPTYGFIYPAKARLRAFTPDPALGSSTRFASIDPDYWDRLSMQGEASVQPRPQRRLAMAPAAARPTARRGAERDPFIVEYADAADARDRTLADIIADVKRQVVLR